MGFTFREIPKIEIAGKWYECDPVDNNLATGASDGWRAVSLAAKAVLELAIQAQNSDSVNLTQEDLVSMQSAIAQANETLLQSCRTFIVGTLGKAEYDEIFAGRRPDTNEHVDLCSYILEFIVKGRKDYVNSYRAAAEEGITTNALTTTADNHSGQAGADKLSLVDEKRRARAGFKAFLRRKG